MIEVALVLKSESFFRKLQWCPLYTFRPNRLLPIFQEFLHKQDREWKILSSKNCFSNFSWNSFDFESSNQRLNYFLDPDNQILIFEEDKKTRYISFTILSNFHDFYAMEQNIRSCIWNTFELYFNWWDALEWRKNCFYPF